MLGMLLYLYRTFQKGSEKAPYMDLDTITTLTLCKTVRMHECTQTHEQGLFPVCALSSCVYSKFKCGKIGPSSFLVWNCPWSLISSVTLLRLLFEIRMWWMQRGWVTTYQPVANSNCVTTAGCFFSHAGSVELYQTSSHGRSRDELLP